MAMIPNIWVVKYVMHRMWYLYAKSSFCPKKLLFEYGEHNIVVVNGFFDYQETRTCLISPCTCVVSSENP